MQGNILNRIYQVHTRLSKRGGRETYYAQNIDTGEAVAIKILKFGFDTEWQDFKLFEREAKTLKNIDHPAIPNYLDYFELDLPDCKGFALVQEYITAPSLEEAIKAGRNFSELEIREIATALLNILLYLHAQQPCIVHRDIKPSNILLADRSGNSVGQVYLIDFGSVKSVAPADGGTITVVGTYGYMPPEQFGGKTTPASDLYSLGATLIYLATGRHPTELPNKDGKIEFTAAVNLKPALVSWLRKMTEPSKARRFQSASAALQSLNSPLLKESVETQLIKQPAFSRIKLRKSLEAIDIVIPVAEPTEQIVMAALMGISLNSFLISLTLHSNIDIFGILFATPLYAAGLSMTGFVLLALFGKTRLSINATRISLTYECLGIKYHNPKVSAREDIAAIECICKKKQTEQNDKSDKRLRKVVVWANEMAYSLTSSVKPNGSYAYKQVSIEMKWLAQEISQWLDMPLTYKD